MRIIKIKNSYFWRELPVKMDDEVETSDGFKGRIKSNIKGKIGVLLDKSKESGIIKNTTRFYNYKEIFKK
jgi:hypothetical protein